MSPGGGRRPRTRSVSEASATCPPSDGTGPPGLALGVTTPYTRRVPGFSVQPDELRRLAAQLRSLHGHIDEVTGRLSALGEAQTGHRGLAGALGEFTDHWRYAMGRINDHAGKVEEGLDHAAESYTAADTGIAGAAGG
jgi:excreted virulence factor EspC (type VII ESX diderm)